MPIASPEEWERIQGMVERLNAAVAKTRRSLRILRKRAAVSQLAARDVEKAWHKAKGMGEIS